MIPDSQATEIIAERFPEIPLTDVSGLGIFKSFEVISDYAISLVNEGRSKDLETLCGLICDLHNHCSSVVVTAVESVFVYKLSAHLDMHANRKELLCLLPHKLHEIVIAQANSSSI